MKQKVKKIFDHKLTQWLVGKGHTVIGTGKGERGDSYYLFKATPEMIKDFTTRVHERRDVRI